MSYETAPALSPAYIAAIAAHDRASARYRASLALYRRGELSDVAFGLAMQEKRAADRAFDAAYEAEARSSEGAVQ